MEINTSLSSSQAKFATWIEEGMHYLWPLFDFTEATAHLDEKQMSIVTNWLKSPFWP